MVEWGSVSMGETILSLFWLPMWEVQDPSNLCPSWALKLGGWQCQGTGDPTGNPMPISMVNPCHSRLPLPMERLVYSLTLCQQIGRLARLSLVDSNSKVFITRVQKKNGLEFRISGFSFRQRPAYYFTTSCPPYISWDSISQVCFSRWWFRWKWILELKAVTITLLFLFGFIKFGLCLKLFLRSYHQLSIRRYKQSIVASVQHM